MFRTIDDFVSTWAWESEKTGRVLANLTDAALEQRADPEGRTLGILAWHLVTTIPEMLQHAGLPVMGPGHDVPAPSSVRGIAHEYGRLSISVPSAVRARWNDAALGEAIPMYGQHWPRGQVLATLVLHQTHHRGQMTVLMRQAGLRVPGTYGPSREEWVAMGQAPAT
jgi:uncharacterized damage-inducible protein DinB